jgi:hypothetical protein
MKVITAILMIGGIEIFALSRGIDGYIMTICITAIAGLAGYHLKDAVSSAKTKLDEIKKACTKSDQDKP